MGCLGVGTYLCSSCAGSGISGLGSFDNPKEAMLAFCISELGSSTGFTAQHFALLTPFYVFIAGPEVPRDHPNGSHHSKLWVKYGTEFAAFIIENGLGEIATTPAKFNLKFHPTSTCQVWLWSPDQDAMVKWYKKALKKE